MTITAYPSTMRADASTLLAFDGPADAVVAWTLVAGSGLITPLSEATDAHGRAWAVFYPAGEAGRVRVRVTYGT